MRLQTPAGAEIFPRQPAAGLGWQPLAASQAVPWWQNLYQGNALPFPGFAVSLSRFINVPNASSIEPGGSLTFGYLNSSLYRSEINYVPLPSGQESYWLVKMDQVAVNGTNVTSWASTGGTNGQEDMVAIDTGTTLIGGPRDVVANIYAHVPGARAATGAYTGQSPAPSFFSPVESLLTRRDAALNRLLLVPLFGQRHGRAHLWRSRTFSFLSLPLFPQLSIIKHTDLTKRITTRAQTYNMSTADFNLGPFGIDPQTNVSTCLGAFFDLAFSGGSRISWVVSLAGRARSLFLECTRGG